MSVGVGRRGLPAALLLLALLALVSTALAHGDDGHGDEGMDGMHSTSTTSHDPSPELDGPPSYFGHPEHAGLMYAHIALMSVAWVLVLPVAVMFSIVRSRHASFVQIAFVAVNALGLFVGAAYNASTPDLYPGTVHNAYGWSISVVAAVHVAVGLLGRLVAGKHADDEYDDGDGHEHHQHSHQRQHQHQHQHQHDREHSSHHESQAFIPLKQERQSSEWPYHASRLSHDSGQGTEMSPDSARSSSTGTPFHELEDRFQDHDLDVADYRAPFDASAGRLARLRRVVVAAKVPWAAWRALAVCYNVFDRVVLLLGFVALCTGTATYGRVFEGHAIYNGLAHWIKGAVFLWFGILALGRWSGCFGDLGWAWNVRPKSSRWRPTSEFVESATIFVYGITNVFLEHLGNSDGVWSPKDLEHISIAALFIGGGLLGMLIDSTGMRYFLNTTVAEAVVVVERDHHHHHQHQTPRTYEFSLNPVPALVVLLVGKMMSSHTQADPIDSMIHSQWGNLLFAATCARFATYMLMYLKPPKSVFPSRPPTELLAAFALISGGAIFMESAADVLARIKYYHIDAMASYTVTMGLVALLMAWIIIVLVLKGWAARREQRARLGPHQGI